MFTNNQSVVSLQDKVIVITGGAGLLGKQFSLACARAGARVAVADVMADQGQQVVKEIAEATGQESLFIATDITKQADIAALIETVQSRFGRIDGLVNNAYPRNAQYGRKVEVVTYEDFCENLNSHLGGYFLMSKEIALVMKRQGGGVIVNLGSIYGSHAPRFDIYDGTSMTMPVEYAAIKGGVINLTRYFASYFGADGIRVNSLSPGGIFDNQSDSFVQRYTQKVVLGQRMGEPSDVSGVLVFLLSNAARYVTGQDIIVDGGWSL